jgi:hypothetical protein
MVSLAACVAVLGVVSQAVAADGGDDGLATTPTSAVVVAPDVSPAGGTSFAAPGSSNVFFGGSFGLAFGDVDYIEVAPLVGAWLSPQVSIGGSLIYRYRNDDRYRESLSTSDYGGSVFGRYLIWNPLFVHAEVEYLSYEYVQYDLSTERDGFTSVFVGGGAAFPMGRQSSAYVEALYNLSYSSGEPSPYDSPWVVRFGIGVGF